MLPLTHRMRHSTEFATVIRSGARARRGALVVHAYSMPVETLVDGTPAHVGLVVGKAVGNSVVRHQVSRRLRAQMAARLHRLPAGTGVVVRALPEAAEASSQRLGNDLDQALERLGH